MSNNEKIYVGSGQEKSGTYGVFHRISFSRDDLRVMESHLNEKGYVNLNFNKRQNPSQFGATHSLVVDTWKPNKHGQPQPPQQQAPPAQQAPQAYPQQQAPVQYQQQAPQQVPQPPQPMQAPPVQQMQPPFDMVNDDVPF